MGDRDQLLSDLRDALRSLWKKTKQTDEDLYDLIEKISKQQILKDGYTFFVTSGHRAIVGAKKKGEDSVNVFDCGAPDNPKEFAENLKPYLDQPYDQVYKEQSGQDESESGQHESKSWFGRMKRRLGFRPKSKGGKRKTNRRRSRKSRKSRRRR